MTEPRSIASMGRLHLDILQRGDHLELQLTGASKQGKFVRARAAITQGGGPADHCYAAGDKERGRASASASARCAKAEPVILNWESAASPRSLHRPNDGRFN